MDEQKVPMPGDAVVLTSPTYCVPEGAVGILDGIEGVKKDQYLCIFAYSTYRGSKGEGYPTVISSSGGPGIHIVAEELRLIGTKTVRCWRWKNGYAQAHNGEDYVIEVPLWQFLTESEPWLGKPLDKQPQQC